MNTLLFTDPHFTDVEIEKYRWNIFERLRAEGERHNVTRIICLGDLTDKKDKFSSVLVNMLIEQFSYLQAHLNAAIEVLSGNHDKPLNGPYYWKFLDKLGIHYVTSPTLCNNIWLLPFSSNPKNEWKDLDFKTAKAIMMHQTGEGATVEGGRELTSHELPIFPREIPVFSGDVHRGQQVNGITYIGVPHPVKFSETWTNRMLLVKDDDYTHPTEIPLSYVKRAILDIKNSSDLDRLVFSSGDQVRVRYSLSAQELTKWPEEQGKIKAWAEKNGILLASVEAALQGEGVRANTQQEVQALEMLKPEDVVRQFAQTEKLDETTVAMGIELIKAAA